jgi:hypothetical protein
MAQQVDTIVWKSLSDQRPTVDLMKSAGASAWCPVSGWNFMLDMPCDEQGVLSLLH